MAKKGKGKGKKNGKKKAKEPTEFDNLGIEELQICVKLIES